MSLQSTVDAASVLSDLLEECDRVRRFPCFRHRNDAFAITQNLCECLILFCQFPDPLLMPILRENDDEAGQVPCERLLLDEVGLVTSQLANQMRSICQ
jgi:hypothetical protein